MSKLRSIIYATIGTSFQRRQFAILLGFAIVPLAFVALIVIPLMQRMTEQRTQTQLEAAATLLGVEARSWLDESSYVALEESQDKTLWHTLQLYQDKPDLEQEEALRKTLQSVLHTSPKVDGVAIIMPGVVRVVYPEKAESMLPTLEALGISDVSMVQNAILTTYHTPSGTSLFVAIEPIRDEAQAVQAVAVSVLDLHRVASDLQFVAQVLESGRVYLVDAQGYLLTTLSNTAEKYTVVSETKGVRRVRDRQSGMTNYTDINGVPIIQIYQWLPDMQLGIVLEINRNIVFHTVRSMFFWSLALVMVMLILAVLIVRIMNRWLSAPLITLTEAAGEFERGNFAFRLSSITDDEFGQVATAFNYMADSIEASYTGLAQQVEEKTAELRNTNTRLRTEIEERIHVERQLRLSEEKFRVAFRTSLDSITITRLADGVYVDVNEGFKRITGYTAAEAVGKSALAINIWADPEERYTMARILKERGEIQNYEATFRKKDGTLINGLLSGTVIPINDVPHIVIQMRDITHRKKTEQALRESEIRYRNLFENSPISLWEEDYSPVKEYLQQLDARVPNVASYLRRNQHAVQECVNLVRIININQATLSMFGATEKEQMLAGLSQIFKPETITPFTEQVIALWENKAVYTSEQEEQTLDGQTIYVQVSVSVAPGYQDTWGRVFVSVLDMTAQIHIQHAIQRRNQELSLLNRVIAASAISMEETVMFDTACRELAQLFHVPRAVVFMFDEMRSAVRIITEYRASGRALSMLDTEIAITGNTVIRYLVANQAPMLVESVENDSRLTEFKQLLQAWDIISFVLCPLIVDSQVVGAIGIASDEPRHFTAQDINLIWSVSDQVSGVLARIQLTQTHRRLVAAMEQLAESIIIVEYDGRMIDVNPAFEKTTGYTRNETIGKHINTLAPASFGRDRRHERWAVISAGKIWQGRTLTQTKSGKIITEEEIISPLRDPQQSLVGFVVVRRDVTRELQLEEQYYQAQKMEAIGRLTGGVAHDFNNLLTAINGFAELMQRRLDPGDWEYRMVSNILKSGQRATNLVRQLLVFSRKQTANPQVLNLNFVVNDIQRMLQRVIGEHIEINTIFGEALWNIKADPTQLEQIIVNLAVNARDAMPDGGTLTISTENVEMEPEYIRPDLTMPGGKYVRLSVADTGVGISDEVRDHIFEPFFSTKETGKGTGLGLTTVYGIVQQHGGFITFDSNMGQGTTFHIYLPATVEMDTVPVISDDDPLENLSGSETILVVEDEESVRAMVVDVLRQFGYRVFSATNGMEGLEVAAAHADELDVVLTDMVMPKLNGKLMADKLLADNPSLCVLFMSGYMADIITDNTALQINGRFIEKPFTPTTLLTFVRRALDQKSS